MKTKWKDAQGQQLSEGDTVLYYGQMHYEIGVIEFVPVCGRYMLRVLRRGDYGMPALPLPGVITRRSLEHCGKRWWGQSLRHISLLACREAHRIGGEEALHVP